MSAFNYCSGLLSALLLASLLVVTTAAAPGISCRDESGKPVDWWVIFKVPHLSGSSDPNAASGFGYAYADSDDPTLSMTANVRPIPVPPSPFLAPAPLAFHSVVVLLVALVV